jgi:hypothetical protein
VVLKGLAVDQEIIQVHPRETAEGRAQSVVHDALKGGWGPLEAKGHLGVLEVPYGVANAVLGMSGSQKGIW